MYKVMNPTRDNVNFSVSPVHDGDALNAMAAHHRRKTVRSSIIHVTIRHGRSLDLVEYTGLSVKELKACSELNAHLKAGRLYVLDAEVDRAENSNIVTVPEAKPEVEVEVEEPEKEEKEEKEVNDLPPSFDLPDKPVKKAKKDKK